MYLTHHQPDSFIRHWYWRQKMFRWLCYAKTNICYFFLLSFLQQEQETSYTILRSKGTNVTLNGLKPDTNYMLHIRARTAAGYGGISRKFEFETSPDCKHLLHFILFSIYSHIPLQSQCWIQSIHSCAAQWTIQTKAHNSFAFWSNTLSYKSFTQYKPLG